MHAAKMISRSAKQIILQQQEELEKNLAEIKYTLNQPQNYVYYIYLFIY